MKISPTRALRQSYKQSHLLARRKNGGRKNEFGFSKYFFPYFEGIFKILKHGADGFAFAKKEPCCGFLSASAGIKHADVGSNDKHDSNYTTED
jgi:hypothetical protein